MNPPPGTAGSELSLPRRHTGDHKISDAEYACHLTDEALISDRPLEVHLWLSVIQSCAEEIYPI